MNIGLSNLITHIKQPNEVLPIDLSFSKLHVLPRGATEIVSASATAKRWKRKFPNDIEVVDSFLVSTTPEILEPNRTSIRVITTGGEDNYDYQITILVTFDNLSKLEEEIFVRVREN